MRPSENKKKNKKKNNNNNKNRVRRRSFRVSHPFLSYNLLAIGVLIRVGRAESRTRDRGVPGETLTGR